MASNSRIYRYPVTDKILLGFGTIMFASLAYVAWVNQFGYKNRVVIVLLVFAVLCLIGFIGSFYSVTLTEKEIIVWDLFRVRRLAWTDIYEVIPSSYRDSFSLSDRNRDIKVYISSQVKGYLELASLIKQRRPDIWKLRDAQTFQEIEIFHQRPWVAIYYGLGSIGMLVAIFVIPSSGSIVIDNLGRLLFSIVGISVFVLVARTPRRLEFQGPSLILSFYGGWKKSIHVNEVKAFYVRQQDSRGGIINILYLELENGKELPFGDYKEGVPILASAFEKWMKKYKPSAGSKPTSFLFL